MKPIRESLMQTDTNLGRIRILPLEDTEYDRALVANMLKESDPYCEIKVVESKAEFAAALAQPPCDHV